MQPCAWLLPNQSSFLQVRKKSRFKKVKSLIFYWNLIFILVDFLHLLKSTWQLLASWRHKCAVVKAIQERTDVGGFRFLHFCCLRSIFSLLSFVQFPALSFLSLSRFPHFLFLPLFFLRWKVVSKSVQLPGLGDTVNSPDPGRNGNSNFLWCTELRDK